MKLHTLKNRWLLPALGCAALAITSQSRAAVVVTFEQVGNDVTATWSGSLNFGEAILENSPFSPSTGFGGTKLYRDKRDGNSGLQFYNGNASGTGLVDGTSLDLTGGNFDALGFVGDEFYFSLSGNEFSFAGAVMTFSGTTLAALNADEFDGTLAWTADDGPNDTISFTTLVKILNAIDYASLATSAENFRLPPLLAMTTINGSHHRILMDSGLDEDGWHSWVTGDLARFDDLDADQTLGEIGASRGFFNDTVRFGMGVGVTSLDQDTRFGGGSKIDGQFGLAEVNYRLPHNFILSSLVYYGRYDLETSRGYALGGAISRGETDAESLALRLRVDWKDAYKNDKFSITPRLAYTLIDSSADAYTETGGATPATFAKQNAQDHEVRLGFDIDYALSEKTKLRTILEAVHRTNDDNNLTGTSGGIAFNIAPQTSNNTWGRLGFDVIHQLNETTNLTTAVFTSTEGYDPTFSGSIGLNMSF